MLEARFQMVILKECREEKPGIGEWSWEEEVELGRATEEPIGGSKVG